MAVRTENTNVWTILLKFIKRIEQKDKPVRVLSRELFSVEKPEMVHFVSAAGTMESDSKEEDKTCEINAHIIDKPTPQVIIVKSRSTCLNIASRCS